MRNKINHSIGFVLRIVAIQFILAYPTNASELTNLSESRCSNAYGNSGAIAEAGYVNIGGIKQWITIRSKSCSNPVVLFVHGGPGNPMSLFSESLYKEWEKQFTIVQWDQRGSGKTYEANQIAGEITSEALNASPLTVALIVKDGLEVADFLRKKMDKKNIIITGTSWGSVVAVKMISEKPVLFKFYVGLSQLVNYNANVLNSYENSLDKVKKNKDQQSIDILENLGPPPWNNPRNFGKLRKVSRKLESMVIDDPLVLEAGKQYKSEQYSAAYASGEEFSFIKFVGLNGYGMAQDIELDKTNIEFKIPIYMIQGEEDLLTAQKITEKYLKSIKAPYKNLVIVPRSGHDPNNSMLKVQLKVLQDGAKK